MIYMISKKRIGIVILCASVLLCICASGCIGVSNADTTTNENQFEYDINPYIYTDNVCFYVDPETGINYLIYESGQRGGMCPRYDVDGNLYISEVS